MKKNILLSIMFILFLSLCINCSKDSSNNNSEEEPLPSNPDVEKILNL